MVDVKDDVCSDAMVYIADVQAFALLVYSFKTNRCWRIKNKLFEANDKYATITIGDESVTIPDGVFGLAVAPSIGHRHQERTLLFHSLADITENAVPIDMINNETICRHSSDFIKSSFKVSRRILKCQVLEHYNSFIPLDTWTKTVSKWTTSNG